MRGRECWAKGVEAYQAVDKALKGTRAKFNATFREKTAPSSLWPSLACGGMTFRNLFSAAPSSIPSLPDAGGAGQGPSLSVYSSLPRSELHPHTGGEAWVEGKPGSPGSE